MEHRSTRVILLIVLAGTVLAGCGSRAAPVPPTVAPAPPVALRASATARPSRPADSTAVPTTGPLPTARPARTVSPTVGPPAGLLWRIGGQADWGEGGLTILGGMDIGPDGNLYVADAFQGVYILTPAGEFSGHLDGEVGGPSDVKVAADGTVYVAAAAEYAIYAFRGGEPVARWGKQGPGDGQFGTIGPRFLAVCPDGRVYVADRNRDAAGDDYERIQIFDAQGRYLAQWSLSAVDDSFTVSGMDCGPDGHLYVAGLVGGYVMVFTPEGEHVGDLGREALEYAGPSSIAVGPGGHLYVGTLDGYVVRLDPEGRLLARWGIPSEGLGALSEGQVYQVAGIAVDEAGGVYIADWTGEYTYITKFVFP